jgi:hypothetical protein
VNEIVLFASTFMLVAALGLQSLNVNGGHYKAAFLCSFVIGVGQMILLKLGPNASPSEIAAYLCGGPVGIVFSMWAHGRVRRWLGRSR